MANLTDAERSAAAEAERAAAAAREASLAQAAEAARVAAAAAEANRRLEEQRQNASKETAEQLELKRVKMITDWCRDQKLDERFQRKWITSGASVETVADEILRILKARGETGSQSAGSLGLSDNEAKKFSICRAIMAVAGDDWKNAGFEAECSAEIAKRMGKVSDPKRFYVPYEVQRNAKQLVSGQRVTAADRQMMRQQDMSRADVVGTTTAGGYLVETINLSFIELLRNRTAAFRLGATVLSGLVGNVSIPKQTGAASAFWLSTETTQITEVEQTFGQLAFTPHTVGGYTEISRLLLLQSSPDVEGIVNADLAAIIGIAVDAGVINGSGAAGQPHGIIGLAGVGTATGTALGLAGLLTAQSTVGAANVVPVRGGWATTFTNSALLRQRQEFANTYSPLWYGSVWDGMMLGYPGLATNQVPAGDVIFGDWAQVVVAEWGVLEVEVNPYANFQAGIIGVRAIMTIDVGVRYPGAFYVITAVT
jgi:HK97 family phage major capsid protein